MARAATCHKPPFRFIISRMALIETHVPETAILAQVVWGSMQPEAAADSLRELERLADTAGITTVGQVTQRRQKPDGATMLGEGKVGELREAVANANANTVVFDNELNAFQQHNLAKELGARVIDRTELILLIFSRRARSAESQIQVKLAQQEMLLSRIPVIESQQRFRGGDNVRGPGESHLQIRNRPIRKRIAELRQQLEDIRARAERSRAQRKFPEVCLVGYTNAGKSTLLNTLSGADAYVDDRLFATLDTKTRMLWLAPSRKVLLTDTVGFIRHLPTSLVASFRSTLDVAVQADLLLLVVDASHPYLREHIDVCRTTLAQIGAGNVPTLLVLNKCDAENANETVTHLSETEPLAVPVSAHTGYGLENLKTAIAAELQRTSPLWPAPQAVFP